MTASEKVYRVLDTLNISYEILEHRPIYTVEEGMRLGLDKKTGRFKTLFLRNKNKNRYYLVISAGESRIDLALLQNQLLEERLSFGSPHDMERILSVSPGAVSPFALVVDSARREIARVVVEEPVWKSDRVGFHPNDNTKTVLCSPNDLRIFLEWTGVPF